MFVLKLSVLSLNLIKSVRQSINGKEKQTNLNYRQFDIVKAFDNKIDNGNPKTLNNHLFCLYQYFFYYS